MSRPHVPAGILTKAARASVQSQPARAGTSRLSSSVKGAPQVFKPAAIDTASPVSEAAAAAKVFRGCEVCKSGTNPDKLLVCDKCDGNWHHIYCLQPKLDVVPDGDWFCPQCTRRTVKAGIVDKKQCIKGEKITVPNTTSEPGAASKKNTKRAPYHKMLDRQLEQQKIEKERWRDTERQKDAQFLRQRRMAMREERLIQNCLSTTPALFVDQESAAPSSATSKSCVTRTEDRSPVTAYTNTNTNTNTDELRVEGNGGARATIPESNTEIPVAQDEEHILRYVTCSEANDAPKISETWAESSFGKREKSSTLAATAARRDSKDRIGDTPQTRHRPKRAAKSTLGSNASTRVMRISTRRPRARCRCRIMLR